MTMMKACITEAGPVGPLSTADMSELLGAFSDVTARLQSSHETLRAEVARLTAELSEANEQIARGRRLAALGEMAAGIAHEIRNPLASIRLHARLLEQDLAPGSAERDTTGKIIAAVRNLDAVVTDVLAFAGEVKPTMRVVSLVSVVRGAMDECSAWIGSERRIELIGPEFEGADIQLACDPLLIHRALTNVVRNAIDAVREKPLSSGEGVVRVRVARREQGEGGAAGCAGGPTAVVVVEDSGPGVPEGLMDRVFNPFFTTRATGTGLGLSIVHRIVDAHGGRVSISNVGTGTGGKGTSGAGERGTGGRTRSVRGAKVELTLPIMARASAGAHVQGLIAEVTG